MAMDSTAMQRLQPYRLITKKNSHHNMEYGPFHGSWTYLLLCQNTLLITRLNVSKVKTCPRSIICMWGGAAGGWGYVQQLLRNGSLKILAKILKGLVALAVCFLGTTRRTSLSPNVSESAKSKYIAQGNYTKHIHE